MDKERNCDEVQCGVGSYSLAEPHCTKSAFSLVVLQRKLSTPCLTNTRIHMKNDVMILCSVYVERRLECKQGLLHEELVVRHLFMGTEAGP